MHFLVKKRLILPLPLPPARADTGGVQRQVTPQGQGLPLGNSEKKWMPLALRSHYAGKQASLLLHPVVVVWSGQAGGPRADSTPFHAARALVVSLGEYRARAR